MYRLIIALFIALLVTPALANEEHTLRSPEGGWPQSGTESGIVSARREPNRLAREKRNGRATRFRE
jgi:hypothetical protein